MSSVQSPTANAKLVRVLEETIFRSVKVWFFAGASIEFLLDSSEFAKSGAVLGINYAYSLTDKEIVDHQGDCWANFA